MLEFDFVAASVRPFKWDEMSTQVLSRMREEWAKTLDPFPLAEVKRGIDGVLEDFAKAKIRGRMPCRFEVREKINAYRADAMRRAAPDTVQEPEPPRVVTDEMRAEADALVSGFIKRIPRNHAEAVTQGENQ